MPKYIDADAFLKSEAKRCGCIPMIGSCTTDNESLAYRLANAPTAEVVEVRHGRWIINDEDYWTKCSVCEFEYFDEQENIYNTYIYCPHCGAKMDKGVTE